MVALDVRDISKSFDGINAVDDLSFSIFKGKITSLIGPNGAGKTTLFNIITGFLRPDRGAVYYHGKEITNLRPHTIARLGVGRLFQDIRLFSRLSVLENVLLARQDQPGENPLVSLLLRRKMNEVERENMEGAEKWVHFVGLAGKEESLAEDLSYGQQKLLSLARLLAGNANLLLLDEPTAGVHPEMQKKILSLLRELVNQGKTAVVIEHNMRVVNEISDWVMLLDEGKLTAFGLPDEVMNDPRLEEAYLGV